MIWLKQYLILCSRVHFFRLDLKMKKARAVLLLMVLAVSPDIFCQPGMSQKFERYPIKTINVEQGLVNNTTTEIITDTLGFTWVSTITGMQRFNGYVMETIHPVINGETITINSQVFFFKLKNGKLWVSYKKGILLYDPFTNTFNKVIDLASQGLTHFALIPILETAQGIYCLHETKGLVLYLANGQYQKLISPRDNFTDYYFGNKSFQPSNLIFDVNQQSVFLYDGFSKIRQTDLVSGNSRFYETKDIYGMRCFGNHLFIVSSSALIRYSLLDQKVENQFLFNTLFYKPINSKTISLINDTQILIGLNNQVYIFNMACQYQKTLTNLKKEPVVPLGFIRKIYGDRFNRIWILTHDDVRRIQYLDIPFNHFFYPQEKNNYIRSLYYDGQKNILLAGCFNGGIQLFDSSGTPLWQQPLVSKTISDIIGIEKLSKDHYLVLTLWNGWFILNLKTKQTYPLNVPDILKKRPYNLQLNFAENLQRLNDHTILIPTVWNIYRCTFQEENLFTVDSLLDTRQKHELIDCYYYTSSGNLWVSQINGQLYWIDQSKTQHTVSIPGNFPVKSIMEDAFNHIWIGTDRGLYVFDDKGNFIRSFFIKNGLLNDCIYAILPVTHKAAVFASTNLGISYIDLNNKIVNYTYESGLQENEFNTGAGIIAANGKYFFGGVNGVTAFYPKNLSNMRDTPILNLTRLVINDSVYNPLSVLHNNKMVLQYNQNHIQFDFAAFGLFNATEYTYKYRLVGFEQNWQTTKQPTEIRYFLKPGNYEFEISCSPVFSTGSIFYKRFTLIILPPWWDTWWIQSLVILLLVAAVAFIIRQVMRQHYQQQLRDLELKQHVQQERSRISRDLHDNLGAYAAAIAANVSSITNDEHGQNDVTLNHLKENSQAIISQLNDTIWALNKEAISLTAVSDRLKVFLHKIQPNYPDIHVKFKEQINIDQPLSPVNAMHLYRILQEGVNNALRHSHCKNIEINIISDTSWKISILDDGLGFKVPDKNSISGNGLQNIRMRSNEAGWTAYWKERENGGIEFTIENKRD